MSGREIFIMADNAATYQSEKQCWSK